MAFEKCLAWIVVADLWVISICVVLAVYLSVWDRDVDSFFEK
ncbi:protein of unknown function [Burkholderia multivorans]